MRLRAPAALGLTTLLLLSGAMTATPAAAQLRPLDPFDWRLFDGGATVLAEIGAGRLDGQRASRAGTEGSLWEAGTLHAQWRTGRVVIEAGGTVQRIFREDERFAPPEPDVAPDGDGRRTDSGDYRIATAVRLTNEGAPAAALLRFGARIPSTDNTTGLDRDATDFFATLGGRAVRRRWAVQAEAGVGIFGTRDPEFEQDDLLVYAARAEYRAGAWTPSLAVVGQQVGRGHEEIRGNESLGEVRAGVRVGTRRWLRAEFVAGYAETSPETGVIVAVGSVW